LAQARPIPEDAPVITTTFVSIFSTKIIYLVTFSPIVELYEVTRSKIEGRYQGISQSCISNL
jgi:hypothetical protein